MSRSRVAASRTRSAAKPENPIPVNRRPSAFSPAGAVASPALWPARRSSALRWMAATKPVGSLCSMPIVGRCTAVHLSARLDPAGGIRRRFHPRCSTRPGGRGATFIARPRVASTMAILETGPLIVIVVVVLLLFGAAAIPKLARSLGQAKGEFTKARREFDSEAAKAEAGGAAAAPAPSEEQVRRTARELGIAEEGKGLDE